MNEKPSERKFHLKNKPRIHAFGHRSRLVETEIPGMYTLPDHLLQKQIKLSPEYLIFAEKMRARRDPVTYIKYCFQPFTEKPSLKTFLIGTGRLFD